MALDLTNRAAVLGFLVSQLPNEPDEALEAALDASAGLAKTDCDDQGETGTITYRPWWVIANALQAQVGVAERVKSAAGSEIAYRDPAIAARALMARQAAFDQALCTVPSGFEAITVGGTGSRPVVRAYA